MSHGLNIAIAIEHFHIIAVISNKNCDFLFIEHPHSIEV